MAINAKGDSLSRNLKARPKNGPCWHSPFSWECGESSLVSPGVESCRFRCAAHRGEKSAARAARSQYFGFPVDLRLVIGVAALLLLSLLSTSCRSIPLLPPADFSAPGWRVIQGQAVWKPPNSKTELAGELLFATNCNGNVFVQFSKTPFPLATAQVASGRWQIEFGTGGRSWRGSGKPPVNVVWFQLPRTLAGGGVARGWRFKSAATNTWHLENFRTGETLEGELFP